MRHWRAGPSCILPSSRSDDTTRWISIILIRLRYTEKSLKILEHLTLRKTRWPELCGDAVKHVRSALMRDAAGGVDTGSSHTQRPTSGTRDGLQISPAAQRLRNSKLSNPPMRHNTWLMTCLTDSDVSQQINQVPATSTGGTAQPVGHPGPARAPCGPRPPGARG